MEKVYMVIRWFKPKGELARIPFSVGPAYTTREAAIAASTPIAPHVSEAARILGGEVAHEVREMLVVD